MLLGMATTTTNKPGQTLREARERAGLTRTRLAALVGCSLAQLANIEQGAVPRRSRVLEAAFEVIAERIQNDNDPASVPGRVERSARQGRHEEH
jgi:transcriptional regulator with XRE-family HTH domain